MALPIAEWLQTLEQMDASITDSVNSLDHHEQAVAGLLADPQPSTALQGAEQLLAQIGERLERHESGRKAAAEQVSTFEQWLGEQEAAVEQWRTAFTEWCGRIQHSQ